MVVWRCGAQRGGRGPAVAFVDERRILPSHCTDDALISTHKMKPADLYRVWQNERAGLALCSGRGGGDGDAGPPSRRLS